MAHPNSFDYTALRQELLNKRKAIPMIKRETDSLQLCEQLYQFILQHYPLNNLIAAFWPIGLEIDIKPLLYKLDKVGYRIALPRVIETDAPLQFFVWNQYTPMINGAFNIPEPSCTQAVDEIPTLVLTPLLGFTLKGDRLGYGKGYYDRTLAQWHLAGHTPYTIGLSWDEGIIEDTSYQAAPHDIPLQRIATPSNLNRVVNTPI